MRILFIMLHGEGDILIFRLSFWFLKDDENMNIIYFGKFFCLLSICIKYIFAD